MTDTGQDSDSKEYKDIKLDMSKSYLKPKPTQPIVTVR